jgi:3-dehydroquinate dehydratase / shikimate dehydrogenase
MKDLKTCSRFLKNSTDFPDATAAICGVVCEATPTTALAAIQASIRWLDCIEVRLDHLRELNEGAVQKLVKDSPLPVIATLRPIRHGGSFQGEEQSRFEILSKAGLSGAAAIDLEDDTSEEVLSKFKKLDVPVILSYHNFKETPDSILSIYRQLRQRNPEAVKIAVMIQSLMDLNKLYKLNELPGTRIIAGMGESGQCTRILASRFGSCLSYAVLNTGKPSAPGQLLAQDMVELYRVREIRSSTKFYGVLGWPVTQSLSPLLHNTCFLDQNWDGVYVPLGSPTVDGLRDFGENLGFYGFSVTHPHKQKACGYCDRVDESGKRVGISNTIVVEGDTWTAYNTDLDGFLRPLEKRVSLGGCKATVYGSGGAAAAAVCALQSKGAQVTVVSRNPDSGRNLADRFHAEFDSCGSGSKTYPDILVNATPVGMQPHPEEAPIDLREIVPENRLVHTTVYDLVYNPRRTSLLKQAEEMGCPVIYGSEMFIEQAARQFSLWTRKEMPRELALRVVDRALQEVGPAGEP